VSHFTDDRVVHVCTCGWTGRWDEAFAHVVANPSEDCCILDSSQSVQVGR
jgi:hypothetical protein